MTVSEVLFSRRSISKTLAASAINAATAKTIKSRRAACQWCIFEHSKKLPDELHLVQHVNAEQKCIGSPESPISETPIRSLERSSPPASAAARLLRAYAAQVEALRRLRNGGSQTLRVEHVHVNEGGQALIGNVKSIPGSGR